MEPAQNFSLVPPGTNPHCFEIITANVTYFVGETPGGAPGGPSGQGTEAVRGWETAIRQALMPVILQDAPSAPGHTPHSKSPPGMLEVVTRDSWASWVGNKLGGKQAVGWAWAWGGVSMKLLTLGILSLSLASEMF